MGNGLFYALIAASVVIFGLEAGRAAAECCIKSRLEYDELGYGSHNFGIDLGPKAFCNFALKKPHSFFEDGQCNDGGLSKDKYCGRGKCNIFGCNCDGGCLDESDAREIKSANCTLINELKMEVLARFEHCTMTDPSSWFTVTFINHCENSIPPEYLSRVMK